MRREGWLVTQAYEAGHWWFRARRDLVERQLERATREMGAPARRVRLLDYGCGTGYNLALLDRFGEAWGADEPGAGGDGYRRAARFIDLGGDLVPHRRRFDVLTALDVLEHLDDDTAGLHAMASFVRPGGQILLTVPAYGWLWSGEDEISEHRRRYTRRSLARACGAAGLAVRFLSYFNLLILPGAALVIGAERLLRRGGPPRSNLRPAPRWLDETVYRLVSHEARFVGAERGRLPAGASLVARCAVAAA